MGKAITTEGNSAARPAKPEMMASRHAYLVAESALHDGGGHDPRLEGGSFLLTESNLPKN